MKVILLIWEARIQGKRVLDAPHFHSLNPEISLAESFALECVTNLRKSFLKVLLQTKSMTPITT